MHPVVRRIGAILFAILTLGGAVAAPATAQVVTEAGTVRANVIICVDPDCADTVNIQTMEGATVTSYAADGTLIDSCTVTLTQADMVDCTIIPAPEGGSYDVQPTDFYSGYVLLSSQPEIFQSEMHGPIYVWHFAPEKDNIAPPPTQQPPAPAPVTDLPSTGTGSLNETAILAAGAFVISSAALLATALRRMSRK